MSGGHVTPTVFVLGPGHGNLALPLPAFARASINRAAYEPPRWHAARGFERPSFSPSLAVIRITF
jgi:hypothetical protein